MSRNPQELRLVQRTLDGDPDAFGALILMYERPLSAYIYSIVRDKEHTRDVAQETFIAAYYALPHWKAPIAHTDSSTQATGESARSESGMYLLAPWLYRIATNKALQFLKRQPPPVYSTEQSLEDKPPYSETPEEHYLMKELLQEVLSSLSEEDALCIVLRFCLHEQYSDIAAKMHSSTEAVRKRISRGLLTLRSAYATMQK